MNNHRDVVVSSSSTSSDGNDVFLGPHRIGIDQSYRLLPSIYLFFMFVWLLSFCFWTLNTYKTRRFQPANKLQWTLTSVLLIKALQITLSFLFWYSCYNLQVCSLWMAFGVYVTGVLFQTSLFTCFLLISHGYGIISECLSVSECRTTAALGCGFYLTLIGQRASVPFFSVLLLLCYSVSFYLIFHHISQNFRFLQDQLTFIEDEDVQAMHDAVHAKYVIFKKFQGAMQAIVIAETMIFINMNASMEHYWLRLLIREWTQLCILLYIGWIFRSKNTASPFLVTPTMNSKLCTPTPVPPIYSIEMDATLFDTLSSHNWQLGVVQSLDFKNGDERKPVLVLVQHPHEYRGVSSPR